MGLTGRDCPDCGRRVREPFQKTVTGREVCPDCAGALVLGSTVGAVTGDVGSGAGVWAMLMRRIGSARRSHPPAPGVDMPGGTMYEYVAWFHDETLAPDDDDYEWPGVILIRAQDQESARAWGDELAKTCADTFVRSTAEPLTEPIQPRDVVTSVGVRLTAKQIGW